MDNSKSAPDTSFGNESKGSVSDSAQADPALATITVDGSNVEGIVFEATRLFSISGKVEHKGVPLEGVLLDGGPLGKTVTGPDGSYRFDNVPDGAEYSIVASKGNFVFGKLSGRQGQ